MYKITKALTTTIIASTLFLAGGYSLETASAAIDPVTLSQVANQEHRVAVGEELSLSIETTYTSEVSWSMNRPGIAKITDTSHSSVSTGNSSREAHGVTIEGLKPGNFLLSVHDSQGRLLSSSRIQVILPSEKTAEDIKMQEAKAIEAVEIVEIIRTEDGKKRAQKLISYLPAGTLKTELQNRLEAIMTFEESGATLDVEFAEKFKTEDSKKKAQAAVDQLSASSVKADLQRRIDAITTQEDLERQATQAVELAEIDKTNQTRANARNLVDKLRYNDARIALEKRLDAIVTEEDKGWHQVGNEWYYRDENGEKQTAWTKVGNTWYYMNTDGIMQTGWAKVGNTWYYMTGSGAMQTGWTKVGNTWYYMTGSGAMQTGWTKVGNTWYYMSGSGAMQTGWTKVGNTWYYMTGSGAMQTGWTKVGNTWYYMTGSGAMQTGWTKVGNTWYYMSESGVMQTGWHSIGAHWYYLNSNGSMQTEDIQIDGVWYRLDSSGRNY